MFSLAIKTPSSATYVDITDCIAFNGLKWTRNDVDGPNAGRALNGKMIRDRVATKIRLDVNCRPLTSEELSRVLNLIYPVTVMVRYYDPMDGVRTVEMYSNNNPASYALLKPNGTELWSGITFPLIEV